MAVILRKINTLSNRQLNKIADIMSRIGTFRQHRKIVYEPNRIKEKKKLSLQEENEKHHEMTNSTSISAVCFCACEYSDFCFYHTRRAIMHIFGNLSCNF